MLLFLRGPSSKRDIIINARAALPGGTLIHASDPSDRPDIHDVADFAWREPKVESERPDWALALVREHGIRLVNAAYGGEVYEARRTDFEAAGALLVTGTRSLQTFACEDKGRFAAACEAAGLAVVPAITVRTAVELRAAYDTLSTAGPVCVKPAEGIFGLGFWRLEAGIDPFRSFANPDSHRADVETFIHAFEARPERKPLVVMPYLAGDEHSIDMVCEDGETVALVARRKSGLYQQFEIEGPAIELARACARHFRLDGLVNIQTREDGHGRPHLLEYNLRYSGGSSYTHLSGVNLAGIFVARRFGLPEPQQAWTGARIKAVSTAMAA